MVRIINETEIEPGEVAIVDGNLVRPLNLTMDEAHELGTNPKGKSNCCMNNNSDPSFISPSSSPTHSGTNGNSSNGHESASSNSNGASTGHEELLLENNVKTNGTTPQVVVTQSNGTSDNCDKEKPNPPLPENNAQTLPPPSSSDSKNNTNSLLDNPAESLPEAVEDDHHQNQPKIIVETEKESQIDTKEDNPTTRIEGDKEIISTLPTSEEISNGLEDVAKPKPIEENSPKEVQTEPVKNETTKSVLITKDSPKPETSSNETKIPMPIPSIVVIIENVDEPGSSVGIISSTDDEESKTEEDKDKASPPQELAEKKNDNLSKEKSDDKPEEKSKGENLAQENSTEKKNEDKPDISKESSSDSSTKVVAASSSEEIKPTTAATKVTVPVTSSSPSPIPRPISTSTTTATSLSTSGESTTSTAHKSYIHSSNVTKHKGTHNCPALYNFTNQQHHNLFSSHLNFSQAAAAAANHLGNILPHLSHHHQQNLTQHHINQLNSQMGLLHQHHHGTGLPPPFNVNPTGALGLPGPPPRHHHHHHHHHPHHQHPPQHHQNPPPLSHQNQNQNQQQNAHQQHLQQQHGQPGPVPFGYFGEQQESVIPPPWGAYAGGGVNGGGPMPLPPLESLVPPPGQGGCPLGPTASLPAVPLPTAIIPLPLDPNYPPAVLPSYPNTPNTQSTSGYSTAGHSRSSSPMGPTTSSSGQGLLQQQHFESCGGGANGGLLPIPPPSAASSGSSVGPPVPNPNFVFSAVAADLNLFPPVPNPAGQFVIYFHINPNVSVSFSVGDQIQVVKGPMTVPLVSTNSNPPIPLPMQVPPGHVVQQIVDENGTLRHVIVSHQPPLMPIPSYAPNSQAQQFYPPGPGYPSAHFTQMQGGVVPCGVPSPHQQQQGPPSGQSGVIASGYPSSIPVHAQKDERTARQFVKLRRKFEQKQQQPTNSFSNGSSSSYSTQPPTVRKAEAVYSTANGTTSSNSSSSSTRKVGNGAPKSPANGGGMEEDGSVGSTGSVTSTGTQDFEEENRTLALTEMLSCIIPPTVTEVTARSAYVQWSHPDRISESGENKFPDFDVADTDFRYEVFISEKSRDNRFRSIFVGSALSCRVKDLKPGSMYAITYCAMLGDIKGNTSTPANFGTLPAEPEPPTTPRPVARSRSSIQFKWNPPLIDNGSKITFFVLEYDEGKGGDHFVETYRGKNKSYTVTKLQPAYSYQFRLAAINQVGQSRFTSVVSVMTAGSPPTQPTPPTVVEAGVKYLRLEWKARDTDDEYTLQMEDPSTGHGFLAVYNGSAPQYLCIGLKRNSQYRFRLRAQNEEGHSKWSDEVVLSTLPDRPGPPHKPTLKGRVQANGFKVKWDAPSDNGGVPITAYALEIDQGNGGYEEIYRGTEAEFNVDRLSPGQSYAIRVIAIGPGGGSDPSESCVITTEPVCPGKSHIPRIIGKPKSNSVHLKWSPPDWDGGSPVNMYEVGCTTPDNQTQEAYRGKETDCIVNRLLPGRAYLFQIRAFNRIGAGAWSDPLEVISGAGAPDMPSAPKIITKTSHIVLVSWTEPLNNGSAVTEYRVHMATPTPPSPSELGEEGGAEEEEDKSENKISTETQTESNTSSFTQVYLGSALNCEVKGLQPASVYLFKIQAANGAGSSDWSPVVTHQMPASSPNGVLGVEAVASSNSISLSWKIPADNGSSITHYNVMMGETVLVATSNVYVMDNLMPDTHYKIRVQAVNTVGPGAFSSPVKVSTKPLPPPPPKLECVSVAHFWMKLKWSDISSKNIEYLVQMINPYKDEFEVVYRGTNSNCKVTRLSEDTEYQFRICALNGAGQGPFSDLYRFCTSKAPPTQVKGCKAELIKDSRLHKFEWFEVICNDTVEYQFQVAYKRKEMDFKTMYRGVDRKIELSHEKLEEGVDYMCRVCAIRVCEDGSQLVGPYSNNVNFQVPFSVREDLSPKSHSSSSKSLSTVQVSNTFFTALEEKMSNISYESRVGILAVFALIILAFVISLITHHVVS